MAAYTGQVWLGSASGRQEISVNSNTWHGAREQIKTIYGVGDHDILDLNEVSSSTSAGAGIGLGGLFMGLLLIGGVALFGGESDNTNTQPKVTQPQANVTRTVTPKPMKAYTVSETNGCKIWADANPTLAKKLTERDRCFGKF